MVLICAGLSDNLFSAYSGGAPGVEQRYNVDGHNEAQAGACDALSDNVSSIYYNPAGLAWAKGVVFMGSYLPLWDSETYAFFAGVSIKIKYFCLGFGTLNIMADDLILRGQDALITGSTAYRDSLFILSIGSRIISGLSAGIRANLVYQNVLQYHDMGIGMDFSLLWRPELPYLDTENTFLAVVNPISLGIIVYNVLGPGIKLNRAEERFPLMLKAGISYRFRQILSVLNIEPVFGMESVPEYKTLKFSPGLEFRLWKVFSIRTGYRITDKQLTVGSGIDARNITVDYGMRFLGIEKNLYVFSIKVNF